MKPCNSGSLAHALRASLPALAALLLFVPVAHAGDDDSAARAVRLSSVDGQVRISEGSQPLADNALINTPLFEGTQLVTAEEGRAEIQFEDGSVARLSPSSTLTLSTLRGKGSDAEAELVLEGGLAYFELQGNPQSGAIRVRFGNAVVTASGFTVLRVSFDTPPGSLAVFSGNAHIDRAGSFSADLHGGQSVTLNPADPAHSLVADSIEPDSWDSWNSDRDQQLTALSTAQSPVDRLLPDSANPAWSDLDASGSWYNVPDQGLVWSPYEASSSSFDPYGYGYWLFSPRFGYTWISAYGWGYMPFQCGQWSYYNAFGWGWSPGFNGCQNWWSTGDYIPNIGTSYAGYLPPAVPLPRHGHLPGGSRGNRPVPLITVNRSAPGNHQALPPRDRATPVTIAGYSVLPLLPTGPRPIATPRPVYSQAPQGGGAYHGTAVYPAVALNPSRPAPSGSAPQPARVQPVYRRSPGAPAPAHSSSSSNASFHGGGSPSGGSSNAGSHNSAPSGGSFPGGGGGGHSSPPPPPPSGGSSHH